MTAKQAKELADRQSLSGIDEIYNAIKTNATQGRTVLWWHEAISPAVIDELELNGYCVKHTLDRDGDLYKISWD